MDLSLFKPSNLKNCALPLYDSLIRAGFPSSADDSLERSLDLNEALIRHPAATFFIRVDGDSMKGANIHKGDILIVDRALDPQDGKIVIAILNGDFTVKRIRILKERIALEAEHPSFNPIEIDPTWDFQVWGVVTYVIHKAS